MLERGKLHTEDGKLVIYVQHDEPTDPKQRQNWLPAPKDGFRFTARFCGAATPLTIGLPDPGHRYQSLMIVSQDHSIWSEYGPKDVVLDQETVGTQYALLLLRTFLDPNDEADVKAAHSLQDAVTVKQADKGSFEYPGWNKEEVDAMRDKINVVAVLLPDNTKTFGRKEDLDPIYWLLGAAGGWGGLPVQDVAYANGVPEKNNGKTPYTLTVKDVPVDAFWSVAVYDDKGDVYRQRIRRLFLQQCHREEE